MTPDFPSLHVLKEEEGGREEGGKREAFV